MILPFEITRSSLYGATNDPSFRNYGIYVFTELLTILPFGIIGSTHLWNSNNPSYWNYGINTSVELRQSFLLELRDQFNDPSFRNYGIYVFTELLMILPFGITGSTHLWSSDDPSFRNYGIKSLWRY